MPDFNFEMTLSADPKKLFELVTNYENYQKVFPDQLKEVSVVSRNGSDVITKDSHKKKRNYDKKRDKKIKDYFKGMPPDQIAEKKQQFKEMGDAWKSLSLQDRAAMIIHFMQMKMQWDSMSEEEKDAKKVEMKKKWEDYLPLSPDQKKQKLEDYVKSLKN